MALRVVRLGSPRHPREGLRLGTVRRPPRGVQKQRFAADDWYDVWFPNLAPSAAALTRGLAATTAAEWSDFARRYRAEMAKPDNARTIALLAALSATADFSVGCYCEDEARCHRSLLKALLVRAGARLADDRKTGH